MNVHQPPTRAVEEEWIIKYRAALNAAPIEQSYATRVRAAWTKIFQVVVSYSATVLDKWIDWQAFMTNPTLEPKLTAGDRSRVPYRSGDRSAAKEEGGYKKAS